MRLLAAGGRGGRGLGGGRRESPSPGASEPPRPRPLTFLLSSPLSFRACYRGHPMADERFSLPAPPGAALNQIKVAVKGQDV